MDAEIVAIGTELLLGVTVDTNSAFLAQQLATIGVPVRRVTLVRDNLDEIVAVVRAARERSALVVCSGGLGPTGDDLTREAIAAATGHPLVFHQSLLDDIAARFAALRRPMSGSNRQQAFVPEAAHIIRNPRGTAPAFVVESDGRLVAALPGVPHELQFLTEQALLPYLREQHGLQEVLVVRELRVTGLTEADAGERIADMILGENPVVGITAKRGQHTIRIAARSTTPEAAADMIAPLVAMIEERFAGHLLDAETLESRVARQLVERGLQLELIETAAEAPVLRTLLTAPHGAQRIAEATIRPRLDLRDPTATLHELAGQPMTPDRARLVVLTDRHAAQFGSVHIGVRIGSENRVQTHTRGIDWDNAEAHDFVAAAALEALRRSLESAPRRSS